VIGILSGKSKAVILGGAIAATAAFGVALSMPASAAKSYNLMLTDVPADAPFVQVLVKPAQNQGAPKVLCLPGSKGKDINTHVKVMAGEEVNAATWPTADCKPKPGLTETTYGSSPSAGSVPGDLTTDNYWFKMGPVKPLTGNGTAPPEVVG
jgi:hypothetical protein